MTRPAQSRTDAQREKRARRIRAAVLKMPGFVELVRASQQAEQEGRYVTFEEIRRKYLPPD